MPELDAIPGIRELWALTCGDPRIRVCMVDGPPDFTDPALAGATIEAVPTGWLPEGTDEDMRTDHGTWVALTLFGGHGSASPGLAPRCTGLVVPSLRWARTEQDPLNTARSIEAAVAAGAHIILVEQCLASRSGDVDPLLKRVVRDAERSGVLLVMPSGNHDDECMCFPQALPQVLLVGAYDDDGVMYRFSGWHPGYASHGIVAPGGNMRPVEPGGARKKGTSCSAPVVAGVAALLLSLQLQRGESADPLAIRAILLETARPCTLDEGRGEPQRCLGGKLDIAAAMRLVPGRHDGRGSSQAPGAPGPLTAMAVDPAPGARTTSPIRARAGVVPAASGVEPVEAPLASPTVYALGSLAYDLGTVARRDSLARLMEQDVPNGLPPDPGNALRMVEHLERHPADAEALIWTLNVELTPIYAIGPVGAHAPQIFARLAGLLADELPDEDDVRRVERVALPGRLTGRTVRLLSRQVVPVIELDQPQGIDGWPVAALARAVLDRAGDDRDATAGALDEFLTRIYFDLRNLGMTASDRALNYAVTRAFTDADHLSTALSAGLALQTIDVRRGETCRRGSDCWDVTLRFFDPENVRRAARVSRFAIDVADVVPVTLEAIRSWSEAPAGTQSR